MAGIISGVDPSNDRIAQRVHAAALLAVTLATYRLLTREQRLTDEDAVDLGVRLILAADAD